MLKPKESSQNEYEFISIDELVPDDLLLRLIDKYIDFFFLIEKILIIAMITGVQLIPLSFIKLMFIGYLYSIRSERKLEREIRSNVAYRWILGLRFKDPVPHHSTISWNRQHRFKDTNTFQEVFDEIVLLAINHKIVGGRFIY